MSEPEGPASKPASKPAGAKPAAAATPARTRRPRKRAAPPPPPARHWSLLLGAGGAVLALDQGVKWLVVQYIDLPLRHEMELIDPWLNLRMAWNQGMNFGILSSSQDIARWILIGIALAICIWVGIWVWRSRPGRFACLAAGLLIGGALGNVIDRMIYGAVADFLNMSLPGWRNPYSFNIADIAIFAGALGLVFQPSERQTAPAVGSKRRPGQRQTGKPGKPGRAAGAASTGSPRKRTTSAASGKTGRANKADKDGKDSKAP